MKLTFNKLLVPAIVFFAVLLPITAPSAYAQFGGGGGGGGGTQTSIKITKSDLNLGSGAPTKIQSNEIQTLLMSIYLIAGIVAVIAIIIGGIRYTTSNGDANGIQSAKNTIQYAVVGLIVVIAASAITEFVINNVAKSG